MTTNYETFAKQYIEWDINPETRNEAQQLIANPTELDKLKLTTLFTTRLEFGTAGLRGPMGPGFNCMNDLTVLQTAQVRITIVNGIRICIFG